VQRSLGHLAGELLKRTCRKALAPELPSDPVADETPPLLLPAPDVAGHLALVDDRLLRQRVVGKEPPPVRVEGLAVAGREGRHPVRLGLALVLEERVEVAVDDFPQNTVHPEDASAIARLRRHELRGRLLPGARRRVYDAGARGAPEGSTSAHDSHESHEPLRSTARLPLDKRAVNGPGRDRTSTRVRLPDTVKSALAQSRHRSESSERGDLLVEQSSSGKTQ
jgi:hypothetical protein